MNPQNKRTGIWIAYLVMASLYFLLILLTSKKEEKYVIPKDTRNFCLYGARRTREGFVGTKFEKWNFFESCVLNIQCSSPTNECPAEEIHEQSKFFVEGEI